MQQAGGGFRWPPDWRDSDAMSYLISDFSSPTVRPTRKLAFWSALICQVCQYRGTPVVSIEELKRCLAWRGLPPMCLEGVLEDMIQKKTVLPLSKLTVSWSQWGLSLLASPFTTVWRKIVPDTGEPLFVVMSVLQECKRTVLEEVHSTSDSYLYTPLEWMELCRRHVHTSSSQYLDSYLEFSGDITRYGEPVSLIKARQPAQKRVDPINQVDIAIGKAVTTRDLLNNKVSSLTEKMGEQLKLAKSARNKNEALAHLRRKKLFEKSLEKWSVALGNTESLLLQLYDSQSNKTIVSTMRAGAEALQRNKISLSEVDEIMDKLDEYKEYEEELSTAMTSSHAQTSDDADLEEELMGLLEEEEEGSSQIGQPPTKKPAVIDLTKEDDDVLTSEELNELEMIESQLNSCPSPIKSVPIQSQGDMAQCSSPSRVSTGRSSSPSRIVLDRSPRIGRSPSSSRTGRSPSPSRAGRSVSSSRVPQREFEAEEHPVEKGDVAPRAVKEKMSPEMRRKPGRKLVGTLLAE